MNELHIWAAGLFDGEGSIYVDARRHLTLAICMTDKATIFRFRQIFGCGGICFSPRGRHKDAWHFKASANDLEVIVRAIKPYLFTKLRQAELALEWCEKCAGGYRGYGKGVPEEVRQLRELIYMDLKALNT